MAAFFIAVVVVALALMAAGGTYYYFYYEEKPKPAPKPAAKPAAKPVAPAPPKPKPAFEIPPEVPRNRATLKIIAEERPDLVVNIVRRWLREDWTRNLPPPGTKPGK